MDARGQLQYIPFPVCNETGRPLEFLFGIEKGMSSYTHFVPPRLTDLTRDVMYDRIY
jgi:hypothetical protein